MKKTSITSCVIIGVVTLTIGITAYAYESMRLNTLFQQSSMLNTQGMAYLEMLTKGNVYMSTLNGINDVSREMNEIGESLSIYKVAIVATTMIFCGAAIFFFVFALAKYMKDKNGSYSVKPFMFSLILGILLTVCPLTYYLVSSNELKANLEELRNDEDYSEVESYASISSYKLLCKTRPWTYLGTATLIISVIGCVAMRKRQPKNK